MDNIEELLQNYRLRKRRQEKILQFKNTIKSFLMLGVKGKAENDVLDKATDSDKVEIVLKQLNTDSDVELENSSDDITSSSEEDTALKSDGEDSLDWKSSILNYSLRFVYLAFWITLYIIAIELQFGIVFLMVSAIFTIYFNTRTGPKKKNEISAYSVFNRNCESIDGTLKAEQFEREIGIR